MIDESSTFGVLLREMAQLSGVVDERNGSPVLEPASELGGGRFVIERLIGRGGMGVVYEASDRERGLRVALKTLRVVQPELLVRFRREFRALQRVTHPNVIRPMELFGNGEDWFFTMELIAGVDFETYVGTDPQRLRHMLAALGGALRAVHSSGSVHRDVKPSNVLITADGRLALLDLGLVRHLEDSWLDDSVVGTRAFTAPELARQAAVTPAADWYAVGVIVRRFLDRLPTGAREETRDLEDLSEALLRDDPDARAGFVEVLACASPPAVASGVQVEGHDASAVVGREETLLELETLARRAWASEALTVAYAHGPSGIGKSTVLDTFAKRHAGSAHVLRGNCFEQESVSYKGLDGIVDDIASRLLELGPDVLVEIEPKAGALLARAFPMLATLPGLPQSLDFGGGSIRQLAQALETLLSLLARSRPLLIIVDDFQWADADARSVLDNLLVSERRLPILFVIGSREARPPALGVELHALPITPLNVESSQRLVRQLAGRGTSDVDVEALVSESEGHPLYLAELVRHAAASGGRSERPRLDDALIERTTRLDQLALGLLQLVALAAPVQRAVLGHASGLDGENFVRTMDLLRREGWTVSTGPSNRALVGTFHDRAREALCARVPEQQARGLHRRLAAAVRAVTPEAHEQLAFHYRAAGDVKHAYEESLLAARAAEQTLAFERAAQLYQSALELGADPGGKIAEAMGNALVAANRPLDAAAALRRATEGEAEGPRERGLLARAAAQLLAGGEVRAGMTQLYDVLESLNLEAPRTQRQALRALIKARVSLGLCGPWWARLRPIEPTEEVLEQIDLLHTAGTALLLVDGMRGVPLHARGLALARRARDRARLARSLLMESCRQSTSGRLDLAEQSAEEALSLSEGIEASRLTYMRRAARAVGAFRRGAWAETLEEHKKGAQDRDELRGTPWELSSALLYAQLARFQAGELSEWRRHVALGADEARRRRDNNLALCVDISGGVLVPLMNDDLEQARRLLDDVESRLWEGTGFMRIVAYLLRVWLELYAGNLDAARTVIVKGHGRPEVRFISREIHFTGSWLAYLQASLELQRRDFSKRHVLKAANHLESGVPWTVPLGSVLRARIEIEAGKRELGLAQLDQAVTSARAGGHHLIAATAAVARDVWSHEHALPDAALRRHLDVARPVQFASMFLPGLVQRGSVPM